MKYTGIMLLVLSVVGCEPGAQKIVDQSINAHGGEKFEKAHIEFDFRGRHYTSHRNGGIFTYTREFTDTTGNKIKDVLNNDGFHREINGGLAKISEERAKAFTNSVNSVIYFALLPYGLNDPAVNKFYLNETIIKEKKYHTIKVSFDQEGGGKDHEDVFLYWINKDSNRIDYFAYSYSSDGGGIRFREAINPRVIEGILFQDYINYEPADDQASLEKMLDLYKEDGLVKLSVINHENITVKI